MREDWKFSDGRFDARVVQIKADPPAWVLGIRDREFGILRTGFETLGGEGFVLEGGYDTPVEGMREAERILGQLGVVVPEKGWQRSSRD